MTSLIESYEQQYSVLTAEITSEIGKLKRMPAGNNAEKCIISEHIASYLTFGLLIGLQTVTKRNKSEPSMEVLKKVKNW